MTSTHARPHATGASIGAMARIEARRLARNPFFLAATFAALAFNAVFVIIAPADDWPGDQLAWPVTSAFFIGLTSLVLLARQTRSTEAAAEAMMAAPGSEADRTLALCLAALVPARPPSWSWRPSWWCPRRTASHRRSGGSARWRTSRCGRS